MAQVTSKRQIEIYECRTDDGGIGLQFGNGPIHMGYDAGDLMRLLSHMFPGEGDEAGEDTEDEGLIFHILDQEDGEQLAEANVWGEVLEVYSPTESFGTETLPSGCTGEDLYREIIDFAAFTMGVEHGDIYLTDEAHSAILWAE